MFFCRLVFLLAAFLTCFVPVHADEARQYSPIYLQASAAQEIIPDLMRVTLYSEARDKDAARLAQTTTKNLNLAIEKARQIDGVTLQTGARSSYPIHDSQGQKIIAWQERAELHLESRDFAALAALSADLMTDLKMASQHFLISKPLMRETENSLMQLAIIAFEERAQIVTQALGRNTYKIVQLSFEDQGHAKPLMASRSTEMLMSAPANADALPQIEAGTREVTISVQGVIEIEK